MARLRSGWVVVALVAILASACGGGGGERPEATAPKGRTASVRGVTPDAIKVGVVIINYDCIKDFVDFNRGDQQRIAQIFVDDINASGGVLGRKIVPVYKTYCPIGNAEALQVCTALTEDEKVFAVLGVFIDFSGDAQLCLSRDHETIHIGHELKRAWIDEAPPGLLLTPDITAERRIEVLVNLVRREKFLQGKKVAVLADQENRATVEQVVEPALDDLGLARGSTAILTIAGTDTSAAQAQLDSFTEKWKAERVDALVMVGLTVSSKQFVEKIKGALPSLLLLTDSPAGVGGAAQDAVAAGQRPNPYEGVVTADGPSDSERWKNKTALLERCVATYEKATGETLVGPDELKPGPDGKRAEIYIAVTDFCNELTMFKTIAERVGVNLTNDAWTKAVDSFGPIKLVSTEIASLHKGKYDAEDGFRLTAFDSSIGNRGDWKPLTDIEDASKPG